MNSGAEKHRILKIIPGTRRISDLILLLTLLTLSVTGCSTPTLPQEPPGPPL